MEREKTNKSGTKAFWKRFWKNCLVIAGIIVCSVVFVFVIPIVINYLYNRPARYSFLEMDWSGSDALGFYGSLLGASVGAIATIFVLKRTIEYTRDSQKQERILAIKPYLQTTNWRIEKWNDPRAADASLYMVVNKTAPVIYSDTWEEMKSIVGAHTHVLLWYEVENAGGGNAVNVIFTIYKARIIPPFCITTANKKRILLAVNKGLVENDGNEYELVFSFNYSDVSSYERYVQTEHFRLCNRKGFVSFEQWDGGLMSPPNRVTDSFDN